jgi:hypothetical protein
MKINILLLIGCVVIVPVVSISQIKVKGNSDEIKFYWYTRVSEEAIGSQKNTLKLDENEPTVIVDGIQILLTFQRDKSKALFCGATDVKYNSPEVDCTVEVAALFYSSYIFHGKEWDYFASGIALVEKGKINSPETISKAYKHYAKWFKKVQKVGLNEARKQGLDPLKGTGIGWYGGRS